MKRRRSSLWAALAILLSVLSGSYYVASQPMVEARNIAVLVDPTKLATLRADRAANSRLLKAIYWLQQAREKGRSPESVAGRAAEQTYTNPTQQELVEKSLLRNLKIAAELGCLDEANMDRMRRGMSPIITRGPYTGEEAEVDHVVPVAVAPKWSNNIANLELLPRTLNRQKGASMGPRQLALQRDLLAAGM